MQTSVSDNDSVTDFTSCFNSLSVNLYLINHIRKNAEESILSERHEIICSTELPVLIFNWVRLQNKSHTRNHKHNRQCVRFSRVIASVLKWWFDVHLIKQNRALTLYFAALRRNRYNCFPASASVPICPRVLICFYFLLGVEGYKDTTQTVIYTFLLRISNCVSLASLVISEVWRIPRILNCSSKKCNRSFILRVFGQNPEDLDLFDEAPHMKTHFLRQTHGSYSKKDDAFFTSNFLHSR